MERARRHRRHLLAHSRPAGARRVRRRRGGVAAAVRSDHAALDRRRDRADRAAARRPGRGPGHPDGLPAARDAGGARGSRAARGSPGRRALGGAARGRARALPAPRAAAAAAHRGRGAAGRDGHPLGGRLPRTVQDAGRRDPRLARRGLRGAPGRRRRSAERPAPPDARRARPGGVAAGDAVEPGGTRGAGGRMLGRLPGPRARPHRPLRGGDLRRAATAAASAAVSARGRHRHLQRPGAERSGRPRAARHRPLPRPAHAHHRRPQRRLPAAGVRRRRPPVLAGGAARPDLQVHGRARRRCAARPPRRRGLAAREGVGAGRPARDGGRPAQAVRDPLGHGAPALLRGHPVAGRVRGRVSLRGDPRPAARHRAGQGRHGGRAADGPAGGRRRRLRQDRGGAPGRLQGGRRRPAGRGAGAHHRARPAALQHLRRALRPVPGEGRVAVALP